MNGVTVFLRRGDVALFYALNRKLHCWMLDIVMRLITNLGSVGFALVLLACLLIPGNRAARSLGFNLVIALVLSQIIVHAIKRLVNRPRPYRTLENAIAVRPPSCKYSFPSGHTATAFVAAFILTASISGPGILVSLLFTLAFLVGISRIYLGFHYPTDVLSGFVVAYLSFILTANLTLPFLN